MKDILNKYPLNILRKSLIIVRATYRLQKKELIEVLKTMKSINKLQKNEVIDLLISHNFDIKNLPEIKTPKPIPKPEIKTPKAYEVKTDEIIPPKYKSKPEVASATKPEVKPEISSTTGLLLPDVIRSLTLVANF
jgi:hypothetical protein